MKEDSAILMFVENKHPAEGRGSRVLGPRRRELPPGRQNVRACCRRGHQDSTPCAVDERSLLGQRTYETTGVIGWAGDGRIHAETTEYPFTEAVAVYELDAGRLLAGAVLVPSGA